MRLVSYIRRRLCESSPRIFLAIGLATAWGQTSIVRALPGTTNLSLLPGVIATANPSAPDAIFDTSPQTAIDGNRRVAQPDLVTELTDNRASLRTAVERVSTSQGTPYYDGLIEVVDQVFGKVAKEEFRGRRALVALTDGVDSTFELIVPEDLEVSVVGWERFVAQWSDSTHRSSPA